MYNYHRQPTSNIHNIHLNSLSDHHLIYSDKSRYEKKYLDQTIVELKYLQGGPAKNKTTDVTN